MISSSADVTERSPDRPGGAGRRFYTGTAIVAIVLSVVAFAPSIVDQTTRRGGATPLIIAHAALMVAWLGLFLVQTVLAGSGRLRLHRRLGPAALGLAAGIVATGYAVTVAMVRRGYDLSGDLSSPPLRAPDSAIFQFSNITVFALLVGTALLLRRRPEIHKRLMAFAVIETLMIAPLGHISGRFHTGPLIFAAWGIAVLIVFSVHDWWTLRRIHPVTVVVGVGLMVIANVNAALVRPSAMWQQFLAWIAT